ncbi:MAG: two-component sensor histidine kinase, partial [Xanthomonadales bacterium]|nr:two-component sensor histidine kinase [Xanthomonadales bacterium]
MLAAWLAARWLIAPMRRLAQALPAMVAGGSAPPLGRQATREVSELADALSEAITRLREQSAAREVALAGISHD